MDLFEYLQSAAKSLFRWEALQEYRVDGDEDMTDWWDFIEGKIKTGVVMQRVRLIKLPLTDYTKKEIETHKLSAQKGDDIRYIFGTNQKEVHKFQDFWMIDDKIVLLMQYSPEGEYKGFDILEGDIEEYINFKNKVYRASETIETFKV
jgi:IMP cyclohydrolase